MRRDAAENVRVPKENILLGEGRDLDRAGAVSVRAAIHHCMPPSAKAEEALEKMVKRLSSRSAFGKKIIDIRSGNRRIAEARTDIEMNRLLCLKSSRHDGQGRQQDSQLENRISRSRAPNMALKIIDQAIQAYGGAGVSDDAGAGARLCLHAHHAPGGWSRRVHNRAIADLNFRKYQNAPTRH